MPTNLAIDDRLIVEAQKLGGFKTKKETVSQALRELIRHRKQKEIIGLFGKLDFSPDYDYKKFRKRG